MLKTPSVLHNDPIAAVIAVASGNSPNYEVLEEGVVKVGHFSLDLMIWGRNAPTSENGYPGFGPDLHCYGVCDSPEQFLTKFRERLQKDPRTLIVGFTHIRKHPENAGEGGGWRWHKWGPYIGEGKPTTEYLDDEEEFDDGVFVYHILCTDEFKRER
jgi:hypothetical protein